MGDAVGQQPGEQQRQGGGDHQQGDYQVERRIVLIRRLLVGVVALLGVDLQQAVQHGVDRFGVVEQIGVEQAAQFIDLIVARQGLHPVFDLAVLTQQLYVLIVGRTFLRAGDQLFVGCLGRANLLVARLQQFHGFLLHIRLAVHQQAIGQHAQAQGELGEVVQALDARHTVVGDVLGRAADLAHLIQGKHPQNHHQAANQGKAEERPRGDIHITKGHGVHRERAHPRGAEAAVWMAYRSPD
ncbi:hypothetical protein D9M71_269940 [compost metagenome]